MAKSDNLLLQESHFQFGKNWARYAEGVGEAQIQEATRALQRLVGADLVGKTFLDIGCGSGIHALAAIRLGASSVLATDIDPDSVATARQMLSTHAPRSSWEVREVSVFDLGEQVKRDFDVVYSWGVLHHTGDMDRAVRSAAARVAERGMLVLALYRRSLFCPLWKVEKRWYAHAGARAQDLTRAAYTRLYQLGVMLTGRSFRRYLGQYNAKRGMDFDCDVHDWLGGWPYESISADEADALLGSLGFERRLMFGAEGVGLGAVAVGCNEYVYARPVG
jgi:2-polyprenyl-6-hydroxyphenyl methylase/3-demethylubiquinone-9 3-methyltransferase